MCQANEYMSNVGSKLTIYPNWRYGQALFNTLYEMYPELADEIRATDLDPFFKRRMDDFIPFYEFLNERLDTKTPICLDIDEVDV